MKLRYLLCVLMLVGCVRDRDRMDWDDWQQRQIELRDQVNSRAYDAGYEAALAGVPVEANPETNNGWHGNPVSSWQTGWVAAQQDREAAR